MKHVDSLNAANRTTSSTLHTLAASVARKAVGLVPELGLGLAMHMRDNVGGENPNPNPNPPLLGTPLSSSYMMPDATVSLLQSCLARIESIEQRLQHRVESMEQACEKVLVSQFIFLLSDASFVMPQFSVLVV
jgi:hypothetical protein